MNIKNIQKKLIILFCLVVPFTMFSCYKKPVALNIPLGPLYGKKILLDPGHAVHTESGIIINPGMVSTHGIAEREVVLQIAEFLGRRLEQVGCEVFYTRTNKDFWREYNDSKGDNYNRAFMARDLEVDAFIKIHTDWFWDTDAQGARSFYFSKNSKKFAKLIHKHMLNNTHRKNRGVERDWFLGMEVLDMPTVLVETAFLSNPEEEKLLGDHKFLDKCAEGIYQGILAYYQ
ncbi:MAG: N-acetylmuramoyl-L-alanine amidase [bacterium]